MNHRIIPAAMILLAAINPCGLPPFLQLSSASDARTDADLSEEQLQLLQWMDKLRFPEVEKLRAYEVHDGNPPNRYLTEDATFFVIPGNDNSVQTFDPRLDTNRLESSILNEENARSLDVLAHAQKILQGAWLTDSIVHECAHCWGNERIPQSTQRLFFWAWVAWRHGETALAGELLRESERHYVTNPMPKVPLFQPRIRGDEDPADFQTLSHCEWIKNVLGEKAFQRLHAQFEDPRKSRSDQLHDCIWYLETFPQDAHRPQVIHLVEQLELMLAEVDLHRQSRRPFHQLTKREQIDELIFQLREQTDRAINSCFPCIVNDDLEEDTATRRLVKIGYDAIPQLIDALDSPRLTRTCSLNQIASVSDLAAAILARITLRRFDNSLRYDHASGSHLVVVSRADKYREWYAAFQARGEEAMFAEGTESGDPESPAHARRLVASSPEKAIEPLRIGLIRACHAEVYEAFIQLLEPIPGERVIEILRHEVKNAGPIAYRILAAQALLHREDDEGLKAILVEWHGARIPRNTDDDRDQMWMFKEGAIVEFLVHSGRMEAIQAIESKIRKDFQARMGLLEFCQHLLKGSGLEFDFVLEPARLYDREHEFDAIDMEIRWNRIFPHQDPIDQRIQAIQSLLVSLLDDDQRFSENGLTIRFAEGDSLDLDEAQCRDIAAASLYKIDPQRYSLTSADFLADHDQLFEKLKGIWRQSIELVDSQTEIASRPKVLPLAELDRLLELSKQPNPIKFKLMEDTEAANDPFLTSAETLARDYPDDAVRPLQISLLRSNDPEVSARLVDLIGSIPGQTATDVLLEAVERAPFVQARINASLALLHRQRSEGLQAIIREWSGERFVRATDLDNPGETNKNQNMTSFLIGCERIDALQAIEQRLPQLSPIQRSDLLLEFRAIVKDEIAHVKQPPAALFLYSHSSSREWKTTIERILMRLLDDAREVDGVTDRHRLVWYDRDSDGERTESQYSSVQVCELAALALRNLDPRRFSFTDEELEIDPNQVRLNLKKRFASPFRQTDADVSSN